jgi:hypothetical protein
LLYSFSFGLIAAVIGWLIMVCNKLSETPVFRDPERFNLNDELIFSSGAITAGFVMAVIFFYFIYDLNQIPNEKNKITFSDLLKWIFFGFTFSFFTYPVIGGAIFIPLSGLVYAFFENLITFTEMVNGSIDVIFRAPMNIMTSGVPILISSLFVGTLFGPISYLVINLKTQYLSVFNKSIIIALLLISLPYWVPLKILGNFA